MELQKIWLVKYTIEKGWLMDTSTRFILRRMDQGFTSMQEHVDKRFEKAEEKFENLSQKIDDLQAFKNKVVGMACMAGAISSFVVNLVMNLIK